MKRMLTMAAAAAVLCTTLCGSMALGTAAENAEPKPMKIRVMQDFSYASRDPKPKIGDSLKIDYVIHMPNDKGTATLSETRGALGAVNAVTFDASEPLGYSEAENVNMEIYNQDNNSLADLDSWMAYVKMPVNKAVPSGVEDYHPNDHIGDGYSGLYIGFIMTKDGTVAYPKAGGTVQYLEKNGAVWQTAEANDGIVNLPNGFEGYVKLKLDRDNLVNITDENAAALEGNLDASVLGYRSFGGDVCGPAVVNAIYGIVEDSDSVTALVGSDETARFLNGGKAVNEAADANLLDAAMKGRVLQSFNAYEEGTDLLANGGLRVYGFPDLTATIVPKRGGIDDSPALKLDGETQHGYRDTGPVYQFSLAEQVPAKELEGLMFYVECTPAHKEDLAQGRDISWVGPTVYTTTGEAGGDKWSKLGGGKTVKILAEGSKKWTQVAATDGGLLELPGGFKGYILIDLDDLTQNSIVDDIEGRNVAEIHLGFHAIGGEAGAGYVDAMYGITDMGEKDILMTLNGCDVYNLVTGKAAVPDDLLEKGPEIGEVFDDIPEATLEQTVHEIGENDLTPNSVKLSWDAIEGAAAYRADVFRTEAASDGISLKYVCVASEKTTDTSLTIDGLDANTRYYVVVNVLDQFDAVKDVFNYQRFMTPDTTSSGQTPDSDPDTDTSDGGDKDDQPSGGDESIPATGVPVAAGAVTLAIAAAAAVVLLRKKRNR